MSVKKFTPLFLVLVLTVQLLPVRQVYLYFFNSAAAVEEFVQSGKGATKNMRPLEEDLASLHGFDALSLHFDMLATRQVHHFDEMLPAVFAGEIQTPPPNIG
jgi:hypothetical protein